MKLHLESPGNVLRITGYAPGYVVVNDERFHGSVVVTPAGPVRPWPPTNPADLAAEHLEGLLENEPEIVLLGTGRKQCFPDPEVLAPLTVEGIGVEVMDTGAACRTYNVLIAEDRRVLAALILEPGPEGVA